MAENKSVMDFSNIIPHAVNATIHLGLAPDQHLEKLKPT